MFKTIKSNKVNLFIHLLKKDQIFEQISNRVNLRQL